MLNIGRKNCKILSLKTGFRYCDDSSGTVVVEYGKRVIDEFKKAYNRDKRVPNIKKEAFVELLSAQLHTPEAYAYT